MAAAGAQIAPPIESDEELQRLYNWVDETPLSRPKRNIARDFADGVLFAECVNHYFPRLVELHNYSPANSHTQKMYNWNTLNTKVLKKIGYMIHAQDIEDVTRAAPGAVERILRVLMDKVALAQDGQLKPRVPSGGSVPRVANLEGPMRGDAAAAAVDAKARPDPRHQSPMNSSRRPQTFDAHSPGAVVDAEAMAEKDQTIGELREMVGIMTEKIKKLEQLVRIKDAKIEAMGTKLAKYGLT